VETDYKQQVRDLIYLRESQGVPIWEIAEKIEIVIREAIKNEEVA